MIAQEDYLVIHKLHALGYTITQITRELGLGRKTVRSHHIASVENVDLLA